MASYHEPIRKTRSANAFSLSANTAQRARGKATLIRERFATVLAAPGGYLSQGA